MTGAIIHFTALQATKLREVVGLFTERAGDKNLPGTFVLILGGIKAILHDEDNIDQHEIDVLVWLLELYFESFKDDDLDILAEQSYHKLTGYWYEGFDPWFIRMERLERQGVLREYLDGINNT